MALPPATTLTRSQPTKAAIDPKAVMPMLGGGQAALDPGDMVPITFTVRMNVECVTDDRTSSAVIPAYEVPLMRRIYRILGGEAHLVLNWLPAKMNYSRVCPLNKDNLRVESRRLDSTYRIPLANGNSKKFFEDVYGVGGNAIKRFHEVITAQGRFWNKLEERMREGYKLTLDDLESLVAIANPPETQVEEIEPLEFSTKAVQEGDEKVTESGGLDIIGDDGRDPMIDAMQAFLFKKGFSLEDVTAVTVAMEQNPGKMLKGPDISAQGKHLVGKKHAIYPLLNEYKAFLSEWEQKEAKRIIDESVNSPPSPTDDQSES